MPKGFSDRERDIIRDKLLGKGREFLAMYGVKKTSVEDITRAAGISKGAFYLFYNSKEELFFEIFESFEKEMKQSVVSSFLQHKKITKEILAELLKNLILTVDSSPILKNMKKEDIEYLTRKLPPEIVQRHFASDNDAVQEVYEYFKDSGFLKDNDPKLVSGILRALFFLIYHKEEIGVEVYPGVISAYVDMVTGYFVKE